MSKLCPHLKSYPIVATASDTLDKVPVVAPITKFIRPYVEWTKSTEPMKLAIYAIDWAGNETLNGFDWMVSWVVPSPKPKYVIKDKVLNLTR